MFLLTLVEIYWFTLRAGISVVSNVTKDGGRGGGGAGSPRVFRGGGRRPLYLVEISDGGRHKWLLLGSHHVTHTQSTDRANIFRPRV